jgi:hypothetical protein
MVQITKKLRFIVSFLGGTANLEGPAKRESRTPQCRQRAGAFPQLAVPARRRASEKESDRRRRTQDPDRSAPRQGLEVGIWLAPMDPAAGPGGSLFGGASGGGTAGQKESMA